MGDDGAMARPHPRWIAAASAGVVVAMAAVLVACRSGDANRSTGSTGPTTFADVDAAMAARVRDDGIDEAQLLVARQDGTVLFQQLYGASTGGEVMPIASASKWLTSATLLTLVDEGRLSLDEPIARWLPAFADGDKARITLRQLLSHTSGLAQSGCIWDTSTTLEACVDEIAAAPLVSSPGSRFTYGNTSYQVAARVGEVVGGLPFQELFAQRLATPLGLTDTRFDGGHPTANPTPAASGSSTVTDYGRFLRMLANQGELDGRRILSAASVAELQRDQVGGVDTTRDPAVLITGIPSYGLGLWRDRVDEQGRAVVVSGSGSLGFYPWLDHEHGTYGIVAVADEAHGDGRAVRASHRICDLALAATATELATSATTAPASASASASTRAPGATGPNGLGTTGTLGPTR